MADTSYQRKVAEWVRDAWLRQRFGVPFHRGRLRLDPGGVFDFDAVSADETIVASISTSSVRLASSGKLGVGKVQKIRADMLFLLMRRCQRRLVVFTERDMYDWWMTELGRGRVPATIEFVHAELPAAMAAELGQARAEASDEVRPR